MTMELLKVFEPILQERGINTENMRADDMQVVLSNHDDFRNEKTSEEHYIESHGYLAYFLPKFHRDLNAIECVWEQAKRYSRAYTNFTLRQIIHLALDSISTDLIRKYCCKARDYEKAYIFRGKESWQCSGGSSKNI